MNQKKSSISVNLSLRFMLILCAAAILLCASFFLILNKILISERSAELVSSAQKISEEILNSESETDMHELPYYISYMIFDADTKEFYSTNDPFLPKLPLCKNKARFYSEDDYYSDEDLHLLYFSMPVQLNKSQNSGKESAGNADERIYSVTNIVIQVSTDMTRDVNAKFIKLLPQTILMILLPLLLICFLICLFITKRTIEPVVKMTESAEKISSAHFDELLPVSKNNNELDQLASTFNSLFQKLKADFERERSFTGNVSHELKTPVAIITGEAKLLQRWGKDDPEQLNYSLNTILEEGKSMEEIIKNLLQMTKLENGQIKPQKNSVDIKKMFERIQNEFQTLNPEAEFIKSIGFSDNNFQLITDEELFHQLLSIAVQNSIKFAGKNCQIILSAARNSDGNLQISVSDNGAGFSADDLPHIFERFYRGDKSHSRNAGGSGLGLSIAKSICQVLGAEIKAENHNGAEIQIIF